MDVCSYPLLLFILEIFPFSISFPICSGMLAISSSIGTTRDLSYSPNLLEEKKKRSIYIGSKWENSISVKCNNDLLWRFLYHFKGKDY